MCEKLLRKHAKNIRTGRDKGSGLEEEIIPKYHKHTCGMKTVSVCNKKKKKDKYSCMFLDDEKYE